jgi:hypothetical protein
MKGNDDDDGNDVDDIGDDDGNDIDGNDDEICLHSYVHHIFIFSNFLFIG